MTYDLVSLKTLKELSSAGAVCAARVIGADGGFAVQFTYGRTTKTLQAKRGNPRIFRTLDAAAKTVRGVGIARLEADLADWPPDQPSMRIRDEKVLAQRQLQKAMTTIRNRAAALSPAESQSLADEAASYGDWLKAKVTASLAGIADGSNPTIPDAEWAAERAQWELEARGA